MRIVSHIAAGGDISPISRENLVVDQVGVAKAGAGMVLTPEMMLIKQDLEQAIHEDQLSLMFQPKLRLVDGTVEGFEVLTRWNHPERGDISPTVFVQVAEATELIHPFTMWVIKAALSQLRVWHENGFCTSLSINVSVRNFAAPNFVNDVKALLDAFEIPPDSIELEITESALIQDSAVVLKRLLLLREIGVKLSIDDFGAGYASLAYLKMLPVDVLKIDRSFIAALDSSKADQRIVAWTIRLAHDFGMQVVAEGVETKAVVDVLQKMGCDMAQGYFIGRPMRADDVCAWWAANALHQVRAVPSALSR
ncbi:putative bifunctional diguanylate cyclase/phosphodiesterase [Ralstonia sp. A12]|uniref:putative bifunctional diguanylate cyclase/phosphodiesterase n=1 Tax=Ralstonia sp. A12 TaxID=1217052 RepID=UPI000693B990|nr:EAL domain-containing protein [Ralstonia sp. A12]